MEGETELEGGGARLRESLKIGEGKIIVLKEEEKNS